MSSFFSLKYILACYQHIRVHSITLYPYSTLLHTLYFRLPYLEEEHTANYRANDLNGHS